MTKIQEVLNIAPIIDPGGDDPVPANASSITSNDAVAGPSYPLECGMKHEGGSPIIVSDINPVSALPERNSEEIKCISSMQVEQGNDGAPASCASQIDDVLQHSILWAWFVMILTLWALFIDDLKILFFPVAADKNISFVNWVILGVFIIEFVLCCFVQRGYTLSMQSLMDLLAVLSLIPFEQVASDLGIVGGNMSVARVARAARAIRILRATRATAMAIKTRQKLTAIGRRRSGEPERASVLEGTLTQRTNIKMLLGVLVLLIGTSLLDYTESDRTPETSLQLLDTAYGGGLRNSTWLKMIDAYRTEVEGDGAMREIMTLEVAGNVLINQDTSDLRDNELQTYELGVQTYVEVSLRKIKELEAWYSLAVTIFAVVVILFWTGSFARDHNWFVLQPVNRMIGLLREMSLDPRKAIHKSQASLAGETVTEIQEIEVCVGKFGQLMKVGFGEAGMSVISKNMGEGEFDPLVPGAIVHAVFGFCDIRNFTDCCEVLNEDTMVFTNKIASIVHECVEISGGSVNKNIGDAFLSVWKLSVQDAVEADAPQKATSRKSYVHHLDGSDDTVDGSLRAFTQMHVRLKGDASIQQFCKDERLQRKLPGYTVKMGYGLHLGWAVEGAVGSQYKVDATYLSPNVNMASRLEAATKQYGVTILMSHTLVDEMGAELKSECRPIDVVTVKGSVQPIGLWVHQPTETPHLSAAEMSVFMATWQKAFALFRSGIDWPSSAILIEECTRIVPGDGPAQVILEVMQEHGGVAPDGWQGYHALTSK